MILSLFAFAIPIMLAAAGGFVTYKSGLLNIAIEGSIISGAFTAFVILRLTGSYLAAAVGAAAMTGMISYGFSALTLLFGGNIFISGLAVNLIIPGAVGLLSEQAFATSGVVQLTGVHSLSFQLLVMLYAGLTIALTAVTWYLLNRTRAGLFIQASGLNPRALEIRGGRPKQLQILSFAYSGLFSGLAGAYLTFSLHAFVPNISSGKGWLALAAIYLGGFSLRGTVAAVLLFAAAEAVANALQGALELPSSLFLAFPYVVTFLALIIRALLVRWRSAT
ncbi:MAG: ABC transporter permease subunit [Spirochaetota bacterium]